MIGYELFCKIRSDHQTKGLSFAQIAREVHLDPETVSRYVKMESYPAREKVRRPSKLDPFKSSISRWLEKYSYSVVQIYQRLQAEEGYSGGLTILSEYMAKIRPVQHPAFLTLSFAPGEAAQVDWGYAGTMLIKGERRRISFFLMVLCYSRMSYLEFTSGEAMEHFLGCHQRALEFFNSTPARIQIDNLKTGVIRHLVGEKAVFHPRYLDLAAHYGFEAVACNVRKANEKGRVENGVGYVKKNFLAGLQLPDSLSALNLGGMNWINTVANVRIHGETNKQPRAMFEEEKRFLRPLAPVPHDTSVTRDIRASNQFRILVDTNRYSVPSRFGSQKLTLKLFSDRLCLYHEHNLVATHTRCYGRRQHIVNPDHEKELLTQKLRARDARWLGTFYALNPQAEHYYQQLHQRNLNPRHHVNHIVSLVEIYGREKVSQAIDNAITHHAFSSQYVDNILQQQARHTPVPGPLHLTRCSELLDLELSAPDLSVYDPS